MTITEVLTGFARTLRHAGVAATPDRVHTMLACVDALDVTEPGAVYWAGRLALCGEPDDLPIYDAGFAAYFGGESPGRPPPLPVAPTIPRVQVPFVSGPPVESDDTDEPAEVLSVAASPVEVLRHRDVAALTARERDEVRRLLALLAPGAAARRSRRRGPARRGDVDPHRTVRYTLRRAGEPARLQWRNRRDKPRKLVLLLDVSGSMTPYADALLRFGHAAVRRRPSSTEVFTIGTRLTRVTRALRLRDPDAALREASTAIPDWHGGTRLADSLRAFLTRWGQRGTARGAVVVVCSDGWERGDPGALAEQMDRLSRLAYRLVWVNPHRGKAGYVPLAGGMAAALPYLDEFVAGHSLAALEELVGVIARA
jgi:uncharacterized protein with von Willebrand factor type A (vWA) domain